MDSLRKSKIGQKVMLVDICNNQYKNKIGTIIQYTSDDYFEVEMQDVENPERQFITAEDVNKQKGVRRFIFLTKLHKVLE